jgi:hypothetical protein
MTQNNKKPRPVDRGCLPYCNQKGTVFEVEPPRRVEK